MEKMTNGMNMLEKSNEEKSIVNCYIKERVDKLVHVLKDKKVIILGHDNIDVDATLSGILMSNLLNFLKVENEFRILEEIGEKNETYEIIKETIGIDIRKWQWKEKNEYEELFLVDHYETGHQGNVIGCIDHHPTKQKKGYSFMHVKNSCATAYLIYEMMRQVDYPISKEEAKMIIVSMMVDTTSFRSSKTVAEEVQQAKELAKEYEVDYDFLEKYCLCLTPIDKLNPEQIISNGQKWYNYRGNKVGSSYLQLYNLPDDEKIQQWLKLLSNKLRKTDSSMLVFIIFETKNNMTYEYQITGDCIKLVISQGILSRGKNIMPLIENRFLEDKKTEEKLEVIIKRLVEEGKTIATMESCTGGGLANKITNVEGASQVLKESYVSYCNEAKIKFGVPQQVIDEYTVYSAETAIAMAQAVCSNANSNIGVGITGQLGRIDPQNPGSNDNEVWYCIVENDKKTICKLQALLKGIRSDKKKVVIREITESLYNLR